MHKPAAERLRWVFLFNVVFVAAASLPLLFAYPAIFAPLDIASLENGFFVRLAAAWLFVEAIASYFVWQRPGRNPDMVWVIIARKPSSFCWSWWLP